MTRSTSNGLRQRSLRNGDAMDLDNNPFEAPPSTLAAKLVNNITSTRRPSYRTPDDSFSTLVFEIKKFEDLPEEEKAGEQLIAHNRRTVYVLTIAILDKLSSSNSDPFAEPDQAALAIDALITAIVATPVILVREAEEDDLVSTGTGIPLWLWLWPRLLRLFGKNGTEALWDKIASFFKAAFEAIRCQESDFWGLERRWLAYLRHCADAALHHIEGKTTAKLPLESIREDIAFNGDQTVLRNNCSYTLQGGADAFHQADILFMVLVELFCSPAPVVKKAEQVNELNSHALWIFESFLKLRTMAARAAVYVDQQEEVMTCSTSIKTIHGILVALERQLTDLIQRKGFRVLTNLCDELISYKSPFSERVTQMDFCSIIADLTSVCGASSSLSRFVSTRLLPGLKHFTTHRQGEGDQTTKFEDLLSCTALLDQICYDAQDTKIKFPQTNSRSTDDVLQKHLSSLNLKAMSSFETDSSERSTKRQKVDQAELAADLMDVVVEKFGISGEPPFLQGTMENFLLLSEERKCDAIEVLGHIPCAAAMTLTMTWDAEGNISDSECSTCDLLEVSETARENSMVEQNYVQDRAVALLCAIIKTPEFESSHKVRILAMTTLRKLALHFDNAELFDLEQSELAKWCFSCLRSKVRELRITAGRTLPAFLRDSTDPLISQRNRGLALDGLKQISDQCPPHLTETLVLAWGQIAAVSKNRELNLALLRLVQYLGHSYEVIVAAASNEIMNTAEAHGVSVQQLFSPFWNTLAYFVVKDLQVRPQLTQAVADLLEITIPELLVSTQAHSLPWLVLENGRDVIGRISQARGDADEGEVIVRNLAIIMSRLLVQSEPDIEEYIVNLMHSFSLRFDSNEFTIYLRSAAVMIASDLLKQAGEEGENNTNAARARLALNYLANQCGNPGGSRGKRRQIGIFLEQHGLGIMSHFSDVLNDALTWQSSSEKIRCLKAIQEMVTLGRSHIKPALPQIYACLQSALSNDELRSSAFQAWGTLVKSLDDDDVGEMLESTFCTIIQQWRVFDAQTRNYARDLIDGILGRVRTLGVVPETLPSLDQIPELKDQQSRLLSLYNEKNKGDVRINLGYYIERIANGNASCATQALHELTGFLRKNQDFLQASAVSEQPDRVLPSLLRNILDACVKFNGSNLEIARLAGECIGFIGCIDPNMVEATHEQETHVVVSNFEEWDDTTDFVIYLLHKVLVKAFLSASTTKAQNFLAFTMQDLLFKCGITQAVLPQTRKGTAVSQDDPEHRDTLHEKWMELPNSVRMILTPYLRSKYKPPKSSENTVTWPIFHVNKSYKVWVRTFVRNLLAFPHNEYARCIFEPLELAVRIDDISVANFLLPYVVLHCVVNGNENDMAHIQEEIFMILSQQASDCKTHTELNNLKMCSEALFRILDYLALWHQETEKYKQRTERTNRTQDKGLKNVSTLLAIIPAEMTSERAVDCQSYARALCHYEAYIRKTREGKNPDIPVEKRMLEDLQKIYTQIDEPDGIEGISAHLHVLDIDQQVLGHRKAGRWTAAQSWYEIKIAEDPDDVDAQVNLLHCMKESGQHDVLLNYVEGMTQSSEIVQKLLPFATEAAWVTGRMDMLQKFVSIAPMEIGGDFNINIGRTLLALDDRKYDAFDDMIKALREHIAGSMTADNTSSMRACHDSMLKLHALTELEMIALANKPGWGPEWTARNISGRNEVLASLDKRLEVVGAYIHDKQYLLGVRRAAMGLIDFVYKKEDLAASWLTSARLARKDNAVHQSYNAVLHASKLGDHSAMIEHARLIWKEGNHRKAIRSLQGAIDSNAFAKSDQGASAGDTEVDENKDQQNLLAARAHLLLAKWLDQAAQTSTYELRKQYQKAALCHQSWERGHYYLGRHYNKLLETQKALPRSQQSDTYVTGEMGRVVVENYLRSLNYGTKYVYQTLPRIITLWLDLGMQVAQPSPDEKYGTAQAMATVQMHRKQQLDSLHGRFEKYIPKMPAYIFYTALPQIIARIAHPNKHVYALLSQIISKVVTAHPHHALWAVLAVATSTQSDRNIRGRTLLLNLTRTGNMVKTEAGAVDMNTMVTAGGKLSEQLLYICNTGDFPGSRTMFASLSKDCGFKGKHCLPSPLAVPVESVLTATLPTLTGSVKSHKAFSRDIVAINVFEDQVMIMSSLAKPRKLTAIGSDGKKYGLLCKPKDDLRKDQRLMEFNSMINRSLKRDAESSKRQLYIKTYAVTPLNEECGIIEWVDGLKTLRDIVLNLYAARGIHPNYNDLKNQLARAADEPDDRKRHHIYYERVMKGYPPVFHEWFASQFPEPSAWFNARLRYTRSCAVMSMVGHVLGLGDRHGENILFEEGNGGTFHVDFNCLFDKGQTFTQPEKVPFRLTHNMVDAMGVYGYEGPFRTSAELTLKLVRQHEETLMTILESFLYDPTLDLLEAKEEAASKKKGKQRDRKKDVPIPTPQGVLDTIRRKLRGLMGEETVPLGVEGQVDGLIEMATDERNLASMYIGWCAFF